VEAVMTQKQKGLSLLSDYINGKVKLSEIDEEMKELILELCTQRLESVQAKIRTTEKQISAVRKYLEE